MKPVKILTLLLPLIALSACGPLQRGKEDVKKRSDAMRAAALNAKPDPELAKFNTECRNAGGRLNAAGDVCAVRDTTKTLTAADGTATPEVQIDSQFVTGKFIVATASQNDNAVDIVFDGRPFAKIPARLMADLRGLPAGRLSFYVNSAAHKDVTVTVWSCYQRSMQNKVYCISSYIP